MGCITASAVFEGERSYNGNIFKLDAHTQRLIQSGKLLGFEIPYTASEINKACNDVLLANGLTDAYVRPLAWRGSEQLAVSASSQKSISWSPAGNGRTCSARIA